VQKDIWHAFQNIDVPSDWALAGDFYKAFSRAFFRYVEENYNKVQAVLKARNTSVEELVKSNPVYMNRRIRRVPHDPPELAANLHELRNAWKGATHRGKPVFGDCLVRKFDGLISLAERGFLSDPPDVQIHYPRGTDRDKLQLWRTVRGSNINEGMHNKLNEDLNVENSCAKYVHYLLMSVADRWNLAAAVRNIPGRVNHGHYDQHLLEDINELMVDLCGVPMYSDVPARGEFYVPGESTIGITRLYDEDPTAALLEKVCQ
jgi:hypothetical protein